MNAQKGDIITFTATVEPSTTSAVANAQATEVGLPSHPTRGKTGNAGVTLFTICEAAMNRFGTVTYALRTEFGVPTVVKNKEH